MTGAGSGIGRAVAIAPLKDGYEVVLAGRREEMLLETAQLASNAQVTFTVHSTDITNPASVDSLFLRTREAHGRLDVLFNNAGIGAPAVEIDALSLEQWRQVVDVNLTGAFLCAQAAFRLMKCQSPGGGRIINNGSISATTPRPLSAPYTATKHAITGLTKSIALDGRPYRIACGQIDIGNADTAMASKAIQGIRQANGSITAEPRLGLEHVARAVLMMANLPLDANVLSMTVMATNMPFVGRG